MKQSLQTHKISSQRSKIYYKSPPLSPTTTLSLPPISPLSSPPQPPSQNPSSPQPTAPSSTSDPAPPNTHHNPTDTFLPPNPAPPKAQTSFRPYTQNVLLSNLAPVSALESTVSNE
ncbi:hypothetical protein K470DRAFT_153198 [Piedraia hortae CBS 480.64]|uniref:Uncharacterized protein n=1 Tax=Piedraia hortae CBS 480.64 TaxID=1314780 RepID=A0A6A7C6N1_9PEZI|nr:hypothetical protein K470DRAFT_153198 [Piedraia hortae CBS 480.64]